MESIFAQSLAGSGVVGLIVLGLFILVQVVINKRLRTPSDRLAEAQFSVQVWKDQLAEAKEDRKVLSEAIEKLRVYTSTLESNARIDQAVISDLHRQMRALEDRGAVKDMKIRELNWRIEAIAQKIEAGQPVTLADLGNVPDIDPLIAP